MFCLVAKRGLNRTLFLQKFITLQAVRWAADNTVDSALADKIRQKAQKQKLIEQRKLIFSHSDNLSNIRPDLVEVAELEKLEEKARTTPLKHILDDEELQFIARLLKLCASPKPTVRYKSVKMLALLEPSNRSEISPVYSLLERQFLFSSNESDEGMNLLLLIL